MSPKSLFVVASSAIPRNTLAKTLGVGNEDLLVDFRIYPYLVLQRSGDNENDDVTSRYTDEVDYVAISRNWLEEYTLRSGIHRRTAVLNHDIWWPQAASMFHPVRTRMGRSLVLIEPNNKAARDKFLELDQRERAFLKDVSPLGQYMSRDEFYEMGDKSHVGVVIENEDDVAAYYFAFRRQNKIFSCVVVCPQLQQIEEVFEVISAVAESVEDYEPVP